LAIPVSCYHVSRVVYDTAAAFAKVKMDAQIESINAVCEIAAVSCEVWSEKKIFGTRVGDGYEWITYGEFGEMVQKFRNVLQHHKIERGDKVALISNNRVEWAVAMYAVTGIGAQLVPMYEAQLEKDWKYIINDSDAKLALVATDIIYDKVNTFIGNVGKLESVICFDSDEQYLHSYKRWMNLVKDEPPIPMAKMKPNEISTIIYTSGTTGNPKGVELSHDNVVSNCKSSHERWKGKLSGHTSMAFLPWSHVYGQTAELHSLIASGSAMGIVAKREEIVASIGLIKPSVIMSVPMLFNKVFDGVQKAINEGSGLKKSLFNMSMKIARQRNEALEFGKPVSAWLNFKHGIADKVVLSKIRGRLGGNLVFMTAGGAATSLPVLQFFEDIGIPIAEGYGLTETSPIMSSGSESWEFRRLGCVGVALPGNTVAIVDPVTGKEVANGEEGEVCQAGRNVMVGYRNNPEANKEVFFEMNGKRFFRTGDLGTIVDDKFLKITGRIKEQFKLENGKYVVPAPCEDAMTRSQFIAQTFMYGDNKPYSVALIVPDILEMKPWADKKGIANDGTLASLIENPEVISLLQDELVAAAGTLKNYERPMKWVALTEPFSQENQMATPKMSLRRNNIMKAYSHFIDDMYADKAGHSLR
jgi:long-chain acyl-CoA synthetase